MLLRKVFVFLYKLHLELIEAVMKLLVIALIIPFVLNAQSKISEDLDIAYNNALKGVHFALANMPDRKNSISKELIDSNQMIAKIKLSKEIGGVSVESIGFYKTYEVKITVQKDYESMKKEGLIDRIPPDDL